MAEPEKVEAKSFQTVTVGSAPDTPPGGESTVSLPDKIGRYAVRGILGHGGFGRVFLAEDEQLARLVAIKVPHPQMILRAESVEDYLAEARMVASLDHPNIVPVFDVGNTEEFPCYVVSKYIDGTNLATRLKHAQLPLHDALTLLATVAEALHHAHKQGLVHRDVKPGNILLDRSGTPFLADFGLALKEEDFDKNRGICGTPDYMSPEQANGEGHRVDGRSDIFSLGSVMYELLTGKRPFRGSLPEIFQRIIRDEPRPPRQINDAIPKEVERICLNALSKRAADRYTTARDMADDLHHFLASSLPDDLPAIGGRKSGEMAMAPLTPTSAVDSRSQNVRVVPKGLRSFDAYDADFFLELLPGPRDREGLPDSIRFWKSRIEAGHDTFRVGLIYGPSGCGKSSLVKAGLLPRLAERITTVYVEATAAETESRLLHGIRQRIAAAPANLGLKETLASLRRTRGIAAGTKVLIVLDQFEQWLHAHTCDGDNTELVQALRQCDGVRLQCIILVRDDFWLAVSRFLRDLEIRLVEGQNSALVDLFDLEHARRVLAAFGRAFGKLPEKSSENSPEQKQFLQEAVAGLSQDGKVISVRLALFAEMMKGKSWLPTTLNEVGGAAGVGVAFLNETFASPTAPAEHRMRMPAAQQVLKSLLPEAGTDIKGHMRSRVELLEASGYADRTRDFDDLIHILDDELRLLTPIDPADQTHVTDDGASRAGAQYYQLTHDFLVPSLRDWLTRKQKESRRGRAEILLADRAVVWNARPENRQLPSLLGWAQIRCLTRVRDWTPSQAKMMRQAARHHALCGLMIAGIVALVSWGGREAFGTLEAESLRDQLLNADSAEVPTIVSHMAPYRRWIDPLLRDAYAQSAAIHDARKQLHASLALLPVDTGQVKYLYTRLLDSLPDEFVILREALSKHSKVILDELWAVARQDQSTSDPQQRLRAACALASYDSGNKSWSQINERIANDLVTVPAVHLSIWMKSLSPVRGQLLDPLIAVFRDTTRRETERSLATDILADYASDRPDTLAALLMDADAKQFAVLFPVVESHREAAIGLLQKEMNRRLPSVSEDSAKEVLAKHQASSAVALLRLEMPELVWPLLEHRQDPRVRSYLIHRLGPRGADLNIIRQQLESETNLTVRRALILSLGEFDEKHLTSVDRAAVTARMQQLYLTDDDPGIHAAAEWLLRKWQQQAWLQQTNAQWANDAPARRQRLETIRPRLAQGDPQWYVNSQNQTMVVIPGPMKFVMGSPPAEVGRAKRESQHCRSIGRSFAIASAAVTVEQYGRYLGKDGLTGRYTPETDCPIVSTSWFDATKYCNWLSEQEDLEKCFEQDEQGLVTKLKPNYLSLSGYRLPTEAEFEYACRAGSTTARYYGETDELLVNYGWYLRNSKDRTWPVGTVKPNDFGLFDMLGNVRNWCQERHLPYPELKSGEVSQDTEDILNINPQDDRVLRGGSFGGQPNYLRSADRDFYLPTVKYGDTGFRVARTISPEK